MKKKITVYERGKKTEREITYIPFRYITAIALVIAETLGVLAIMTLLTVYLPYFFIAQLVTQLAVAIAIINRDDNPDYKLPWLFFVMLIPVIGFMLYFMFYSHKLDKKQVARLKKLTEQSADADDTDILAALSRENALARSQAEILATLSGSHLYGDTDMQYFPLGEELFAAMAADLKRAEKFVFMEYFIIENGLFWNTILQILTEKAASGVEVRLIYDDIGCMTTLPGNYCKTLARAGIKAVPFFRLRGQANNEFNNRSHRKITVIDGEIGYTGGVNIADEYINRVVKYGHWKDAGLRLRGEAVNELTRLFLIDYGLNDKKANDDFKAYYRRGKYPQSGYCIPFGDGPKPVYGKQVSKTVITNMLCQAKRYVYVTTPYLIIDNELVRTIENTAMRGVDVRIITPHIPDKKIVFLMTRSHYARLIAAGVKIYEYERGFIHAKTYLCDDEIALIGTMNLDYRSLVHHFENGVWIYKYEVIKDVKRDFAATVSASLEFGKDYVKEKLPQRFIRSPVKIFSPLL